MFAVRIRSTRRTFRVWMVSAQAAEACRILYSAGLFASDLDVHEEPPGSRPRTSTARRDMYYYFINRTTLASASLS